MKTLAMLGVLTLFAGYASAATVNGILMDKMCSAKAVSGGGQSVASAHETKCALMPPCQASGYGVYTADNKFLAFDSTGNEKALAALKATKKTDNLRVRVMGNVSGDTIMVTDLKLR